ncbi:MAG: septum formation initiator family protein [bacterium]|nr:septum formation initiator family protein [bacterium]
MTKPSDSPEYQVARKARIKRWLYAISLIALAMLMTSNFTKYYWQHTKHLKKLDSLNTTFKQIQRENTEIDSLTMAIDYGDPETIEWVARYQWHLAREGERVFQLVPENSDPQPQKK